MACEALLRITTFLVVRLFTTFPTVLFFDMPDFRSSDDMQFQHNSRVLRHTKCATNALHPLVGLVNSIDTKSLILLTTCPSSKSVSMIDLRELTRSPMRIGRPYRFDDRGLPEWTWIWLSGKYILPARDLNHIVVQCGCSVCPVNPASVGVPDHPDSGKIPLTVTHITISIRKYHHKHLV